MHERILQPRNSKRSISMRVQLDKRKPPVRLHPDLDDIPITLEQGDEVRLRSVGDQVADIHCGVVLWCLGGHLFEGGGRWCHYSGASLGLLVGPVYSDGAGA